MANLKVRGVRESIKDKGPQNGSSMSMDYGDSKINNTAMKGCETSYPTSAPCIQPNSSLGAKMMHHNRPGKKALGG